MKQIWLTYFNTYPKTTIQDFIKLIYQSVLGSGHLIQNIDDNYHYLCQEYASISYDAAHPLIEEISDQLVRVHLEAIQEIDLKIFHQLFMKSVSVSSSKEELISTFKEVENGIVEGWIPFSLEDWKQEVEKYILKGCPMISHSSVFKENYHPHYRLMKKEYVKLLDILMKINRLENHSVISIDGMCGSGKTTLASFLQELYQFPIVHMDDFFLQSYQRSKERLQEVGGNIDYERFFNEVVSPISKKESFSYQVFDCHSMSLTHNQKIHFDRCLIVEGCYSQHPYFKDYSDLKLFLSISENKQHQRILKRNGEKMLEKFIHEWIPKENKYFQAFEISKQADIVIYEE